MLSGRRAVLRLLKARIRLEREDAVRQIDWEVHLLISGLQIIIIMEVILVWYESDVKNQWS